MLKRKTKGYLVVAAIVIVMDCFLRNLGGLESFPVNVICDLWRAAVMLAGIIACGIIFYYTDD